MLSGCLDSQDILTEADDMTDVDVLERELTLTAAVTRLEQLRVRAALADPDPDVDGGSAGLSRAETLELLALGEVVVRKAATGRQLDVRAARAAGASWAEIGRALGAARQSVWEAHRRWIDGQEAQHGAVGQLGFDSDDAAAARVLAGDVTG
jgi:hypothetical protein